MAGVGAECAPMLGHAGAAGGRKMERQQALFPRRHPALAHTSAAARCFAAGRASHKSNCWVQRARRIADLIDPEQLHVVAP
jgi:hypothetical protein